MRGSLFQVHRISNRAHSILTKIKLMYFRSIIIFSIIMPLQIISPDYQHVETRYFDFFFTEKNRSIVETLALESDTIAVRIGLDLGVAIQEKITVQVAESGDFQELQPQHYGLPEWVSGVAYRTLSLIILKSPSEMSGAGYDLKKTFVHELSHVLLGSAFKKDEEIPQWLNEGVAMYESREWNFSRVSTMTQAVLTDALLPLSHITSGFPGERRKAELAYCQSFYLISFMISEYGKGTFHEFIHYYSKSKILDDALLKIYGVNLEQMEEKWYSYLKMRFSWIPILCSAGTLWFLMSLIFICSYIRKKRTVQMTIQRWQEEERFKDD